MAGYSLEDFAEDVDLFMATIGISSAVLVGSSSGGYVAQQVAIASPHRVAGLVLVGSPRDLQRRPSFANEVAQLTDPMDPAWVRKSLSWFPDSMTCRSGTSTTGSGTVCGFLHMCGATHSADSSLRDLPLARQRSARRLSSFGAITTNFSREDQEALAAAIPSSRLAIYQNTGHLVLWEQPERLASDLMAFMGNPRGGDPP